MSLHQFILALIARARVFAMVLAATVITALIVSLLIPRTYVAGVSLLVDGRDSQSMATESRSVREQTGYIQTQVDIINSRPTARKVVDSLKLADHPKLRKEAEGEVGGKGGSIEDYIAGELLKKLKVDTSQSSVIHLMYAASDPQLASDIANGFAKAYVETSLALRIEPTKQAATWFNEQLTELRANLEQAQAKLQGYLESKGIVAEDERADTESTRLAELSTQVSIAQAASYEAQTRQKQIQAAMSGGSAENLPEVQANPLIQGLKTDIARAETRLQEMSGNFGPNHPAYKRQQGEIQALRSRLSSETVRVAKSFDSAASQAASREGQLRAALNAQRSQVLSKKGNRAEMAVLTREVESAQRVYDAALARYVVNKVESRARQTNVAVLNPAIAPLKHTSPKVTLNTLLAIVVGILLGFGAVYALETLDPRVRSRGDLESQLNLPLLVVLDDGQLPASRRLLGSVVGSQLALTAPR
jgi:succinoglycan biosynthesis transport protein ExoP